MRSGHRARPRRGGAGGAATGPVAALGPWRRSSRMVLLSHVMLLAPALIRSELPPSPGGHRLAVTWSDAERQPAQSGLITGGADLLCDGRSRASHLDAARPDQSTSPATTPFEGDACRRSSHRAVNLLRRSRTRSRAGKATVRPASSPDRCCSASAATAARVR